MGVVPVVPGSQVLPNASDSRVSVALPLPLPSVSVRVARYGSDDVVCGNRLRDFPEPARPAR